MTSQIRSLLITAETPYPPTSGVPLRNWQHINTLAAVGPVGLISLGTKEPEEDVPIVQYRRHVIVERPETAGAARIAYPILTDEQSRLARPVLDEAIRVFAPQVVIFSNLVLADRMQLRTDSGPKFVFDSHNVYASIARELGQSEVRVAEVEAEQVRRFDQIWLCSESDERLIHSMYGSNLPTAVVPNGIDVDYYEGVRSGAYRALRKAAPTLVFVGAYWYAPNRIGAEWLLDRVMPLLGAALPGSRLLLVGAAPSEKMVEAGKHDRSVTIAGKVPDVRPYLGAADIVVVPLFQGGGTRLKILEAFAAGRPVVTTVKGVEGLGVRNGVEVLVRDDPEGFVQAIEAVWANRVLGDKLAKTAYEFLQGRYSWAATGPLLQKALSSLDRWDL